MYALALQAAALAELRAQLTLPFVGGISADHQDKPKPQAGAMPDITLDAHIDVSLTADAHKPRGKRLTDSACPCFGSTRRPVSVSISLLTHTPKILAAIVVCLHGAH